VSYHTHTGDIFDELQTQIEKQCPQSSTYTSMLARADELEQTWNPTGFYSWEDMSNVLAATVQLAGQASSAAIQFWSGDSIPRMKDRVRAAQDAYHAIAKRSLDYVEAWRAARLAGKPVAAPGFKRWVIDDLRAAANLFRTVEIASCTRPWWVGAAASYGRAFSAVIDVAKRVGKVVLKVGESALTAVERTGDIVSLLIKVVPYLALGAGVFLVYRYAKKAGQ